MYGMEYSQIIHSSGSIKWQIDQMTNKLGMKIALTTWAEHFFRQIRSQKNVCANIGRVLDIKSDRLLEKAVKRAHRV